MLCAQRPRRMGRALLFLALLLGAHASVFAQDPWDLEDDEGVARIVTPWAYPNQPSRALLKLGAGDASMRADITVDIDLHSDLAAEYVGVSSASALTDALTVTATLTGNTLEIDIDDDGTTEFIGYRGWMDIVWVDFGPVSLGSYSVTPTAVEARDLTTGQPLAITWTLAGATVDVDVPTITTTSIDNAVSNHLYAAHLHTTHFQHPITYTLVSGSLPGGLDMTEGGSVLGKANPGTAGLHNFTVRATGIDGQFDEQSYTLQVDDAIPQIIRVFYKDTDDSDTINAGDILELYFEEHMLAGPAWQDSVHPSYPPDSLGTSPTINTQTTTPGVIEIILGAGAQFNSLGNQSGITAEPATNGVTDCEGNGPATATALVEHKIPDTGRLRWSVNQPIENLELTAPPFPDPGYTVTGLPPGVTCQNGEISGTPTTKYWSELIQVLDSSQNEVWRWWVFVDDGVPAAALDLDEMGVDDLHPGSILYCSVLSSDESTPVTATLDGKQLIVANEWPHSFVLPDNASTGDLVISQGLETLDLGPRVVTAVTNPTPQYPYIDSSIIWYHGDYPDGVVHIQGCNFSPTADYVISNAANSEEMTPIVSGLTYAILPLPLWVRTGGNWTITVQNPGNKEGTLTLAETCDPPPNITRKNISRQERLKALCKLLDYIFRKLKMNSEEYRRRFKLLAIALSAVETDVGANSRKQTSGGPGRGLTQFEPEKWAALICHIETGQPPAFKDCKQQILEMINMTTEQWNDLVELAKKIKDDGGGNHHTETWLDGEALICTWLAEHERADILALALTRKDWRRWEGSLLHPVDDPGPKTNDKELKTEDKDKKPPPVCPPGWSQPFNPGNLNLIDKKDLLDRLFKEWAERWKGTSDNWAKSRNDFDTKVLPMLCEWKKGGWVI